MKRRGLLLAGSAGLFALDAALAQAARTGFDSQGLTATLQALGLSNPLPSTDLLLQLPEIAEAGQPVPLTLHCKLPGVTKLWLLAERNQPSLLASLEIGEGLEAQLATQVLLQDNGLVYGLALLQDKKLLLAQQDVKLGRKV